MNSTYTYEVRVTRSAVARKYGVQTVSVSARTQREAKKLAVRATSLSCGGEVRTATLVGKAK